MPLADLILYNILRLYTIMLVGLLAGLLVIKANVKVNYTRKLIHFALFFIPLFLTPELDLGEVHPSLLIGSTGVVLTLSLFPLIKPIRSRVRFIQIIFQAMDRPEDRPYTLFWLSTQVVAGYLVLIPLIFLFGQYGMSQLMLVPVFINGLGDGLAEPVGVRFGKHSYKTRSLFGKREYERTVEGSACVFLASILMVILFQDYFTTSQFVAALVLMPVLMTLAEAFSPHTWDSPFLFLVGGLTLLGIINFI